MEVMEELEVVGDEMASLTPAERQADRTTAYVVVAAIMSAIGGVLFGYDIGIVSGALLQLKDHFELSCLQQEMVVSFLLVGALVGALFGGFLVDWIGRRWAIIINSGIFITGAVILTCAPVYEVLIAGRLVVGFAVSLSAIAECIYISEISPVTKRGQLVCVNEVGITLGLLLAYLINYLLISVPSGWRYMFGLSIFPAVMQGVGMFLLPPSPRFLMQKGREARARTVLKKLRGTELIEGELSNIRNSLLTERDYRVCDILSSVNNMRGRFLIGVGLVFFQQFTGQTNVLYYAPTIFKSLGFKSDTAATLATVGLGLVKVVSTFICLLCVDKAGRRHFLLFGAGSMTLIIVTLGVVARVSLPATANGTCTVYKEEKIPPTVIIPPSQDESHRQRRSVEPGNMWKIPLTNLDLASMKGVKNQGSQPLGTSNTQGLSEDGLQKLNRSIKYSVNTLRRMHPDSNIQEHSHNPLLSPSSTELLNKVGSRMGDRFKETQIVKKDIQGEHYRNRVRRDADQGSTPRSPTAVAGVGLSTDSPEAEHQTHMERTDQYATLIGSSVMATLNNAGEQKTDESDRALTTSSSLDATIGDSSSVNTTEAALDEGPGAAQIVAVISLTLYVGAYSYGFGPVSWLLLSEIFPVGIRGRASSLASVFNWGTNVVVSLTFLDVINGIGPSWTFLLYGVICAVSFVFIYCIVPETKNRSLEQISAQLNKKSHMTGLSGHCCFQRLGACSCCCQSNSHQQLPLSDSCSDFLNLDDEEIGVHTSQN